MNKLLASAVVVAASAGITKTTDKPQMITYVGQLALLEQTLDKFNEDRSPQNKALLKQMFPPASPKVKAQKKLGAKPKQSR